MFNNNSIRETEGCLKNTNMTTRERFEQLKALDMNVRSAIEQEKVNIELEKLADIDPEGFESAVMESARQTLYDAKSLTIKKQMSQISDIVSMSYIAKTYFSKSSSWLSQRINQLDVNGKPARFLPEEIEVLNFAFKDISKKVGKFRISC